MPDDPRLHLAYLRFRARLSENPDQSPTPAETDGTFDFTKLVSLVSFCAFLFSIVHEWGYFHVIGLQYITLASPVDYLASTLLWLPLAVGCVASFVGLSIATHDILEGHFSWDARKMQAAYLVGGVVFFLMALIIRSFLERGGIVGIICFMILFFAANVYVFKFGSSEQSAGFFALALVLTIVYILGNDQAHDSHDKAYQISLRGKSVSNVTDVRRVFILRKFDKGMLVEDSISRVIVFFPWQEIASVSEESPRPARKSVVCTFLPKELFFTKHCP